MATKLLRMMSWSGDGSSLRLDYCSGWRKCSLKRGAGVARCGFSVVAFDPQELRSALEHRHQLLQNIINFGNIIF
jgi:hypothetical protein